MEGSRRLTDLWRKHQMVMKVLGLGVRLECAKGKVLGSKNAMSIIEERLG